jgi:hypothetical protein
MYRNIALLFVITVALPIVTAYGATVIPSSVFTIFPRECQLAVNEELSLTLYGLLPKNVVVSWDVDQGGITSVLPGRDAVLVAPSVPTVLTVSVSISPEVPGLPAITRRCTVTARAE